MGSPPSSLEPMDSPTPCSASLPRCAFCRYASKVRAVCVNALVRICAGGVEQSASLPRPSAHACDDLRMSAKRPSGVDDCRKPDCDWTGFIPDASVTSSGLRQYSMVPLDPVDHQEIEICFCRPTIR